MDYDIENDDINLSSDIEDLENRIEELENTQLYNRGRDYSGAILFYIPGLVLAMILSYTANQSILWAILHGYCSWFYVIYFSFFL